MGFVDYQKRMCDFIACIIVLWCSMMLARWHKKNPFKAPRKGLGAFESLVEFIYVGVIKATLKDKAPKFAPYLLTVFYVHILHEPVGFDSGVPRRR